MLARSSNLRNLDAIIHQVSTECSRLGVTIAGGHTEVAPIERTIVSSTMIGFVQAEKLARRPIERGDAVLITKGAGIEGTSIIANEMGERVEAQLDPGVMKRARAFSSRISVVTEAMAFAEEGARRMHDPTEGGVIGGLLEMCTAAEATIEVWPDRIPVEPETLAICSRLGVDPLRLMGSGALLCILPAASVDQVMARLGKLGVPAARIGVVSSIGGAGLHLRTDEGREEVAEYPTDELWRLMA
jgi:hydrogenase maturation factor